MKKLTILFFFVLLFSCCPEKKKKPQPKEEAKINKVVEVDSSRHKTISKEKGADIPDDDLEEMEKYFEGEFGPVQIVLFNSSDTACISVLSREIKSVIIESK